MRLFKHVLQQVERELGDVTSAEDLQILRTAVEEAKLNLSTQHTVEIDVTLNSVRTSARSRSGTHFRLKLTRDEFEEVNADLFKKVLTPIRTVLEAAELSPAEIDEVVLVGGSTRIPKVRQLIADYFHKQPDTSVDPELAVVTGVAIQAGILGGAWPLQVSALEVQRSVQKISVTD